MARKCSSVEQIVNYLREADVMLAQDQLDANRANVARAAVGVFRALGGVEPTRADAKRKTP